MEEVVEEEEEGEELFVSPTRSPRGKEILLEQPSSPRVWLERQDSLCESVSSTDSSDWRRPRSYYEAHDGRHCMEWESVHSSFSLASSTESANSSDLRSHSPRLHNHTMGPEELWELGNELKRKLSLERSRHLVSTWTMEKLKLWLLKMDDLLATLAVTNRGLIPPRVRWKQKSRLRLKQLAGAEPLPPPVQIGEVTEEELLQYDGSDPKKPLLMAIKGQIYDVSQSRIFYGPEGPYALFAGRDASKALAKMSFEEKDLTGDISGLGPFELDALNEWEYKFMGKYAEVGTVKKPAPDADGDSSGPAEATIATSETTPSENASSSQREVGEKGYATIEHKEANTFEADAINLEVNET